MQAGLVSVMMPAYNAERYIGQAIQSVLNQTYQDWELIIVNDGSHDGTAYAAGQFTDSRIQIIHQANGGESSARNTALKHMHGEFVAFLDADDLYLPDHLEVTVRYLQAHPALGGVYTDGYHCDRNGNRLHSLSIRRRGPFEGHIFEEVVFGSDVFGPPVCVVLRRNTILENELKFDREITIGPDWVFFTEFSDLVDFGYLDLHTCMYRIHQENITSTTSSGTRALDLAKCRERSIGLGNFKSCSLATRWNVFYDLLINLLSEFPERQVDITSWQEFNDLPPVYRAKLYRLMASRAIVTGNPASPIQEYLRCSIELNPRDWRGAILSITYKLNSSLCQKMLRQRTGYRANSNHTSPYTDVGIVASAK